jgi:hypothetical protein
MNDISAFLGKEEVLSRLKTGLATINKMVDAA